MQVHVGSHLIGLFSSPLTWAVISLKLEVEGSLSFFCFETVFRVPAKKKKKKENKVELAVWGAWL